MKTLKTEDQSLKDAAKTLKQANGMFAAAKKMADAAKEKFARWLKDERKIDLESLSIGEIIQIEGIVLIEINKQNKFDEALFSLEHPEEHAAYHRDKAVKKFKPLV